MTTSDRVFEWLTKGKRSQSFFYGCYAIGLAFLIGGAWFFQSHVKAAYGAKQTCQCVCQP